MLIKKNIFIYSVISLILVVTILFSFKQNAEDNLVVSKIVDLQKEEIRFYW